MTKEQLQKALEEAWIKGCGHGFSDAIANRGDGSLWRDDAKAYAAQAVEALMTEPVSDAHKLDMAAFEKALDKSYTSIIQNTPYAHLAERARVLSLYVAALARAESIQPALENKS